MRRYERGENRHKHVGRGPEPQIVLQDGERVGKCPSGRQNAWRDGLLQGAIGYFVVEPYSLAFPKRLYAVDADGTIYTAQTSNPGDSYHGYPYAGPMGRRLVEALRQRAVVLGCEPKFEAWLKKYIERAGKPDI